MKESPLLAFEEATLTACAVAHGLLKGRDYYPTTKRLVIILERAGLTPADVEAIR